MHIHVTQVWSKKNVPVPGNQTSCTFKFHPQAPDVKNKIIHYTMIIISFDRHILNYLDRLQFMHI